MKSDDTVDTDGGNTKSPSERSRGWCFTWNNPESETQLIEILDVSGCVKYAFQLEEGTLGTKHFQGWCYYENARGFNAMKELCRKIHWSRMKSLKDSIRYCFKEQGRLGGPWFKGVNPPRDLGLITDLRPWQENVVNIIKGPVDPRKIFWIVGYKGNNGKTELCKYICAKFNALYVCGKASDIKYAVGKWIEKKGQLDIALFDFVRSAEDYISYDAIETLKNGIMFSGKYESGMCLFAKPHIFCFANFLPEKSKLSLDRWEIIELDEKPQELSEYEFLSGNDPLRGV